MKRLLLISVIALGACADAAPEAACLRVEPVQRFGQPGELADVRGAFLADDGTLYVLDSDRRTIVGFAPDGTVARTTTATQSDLQQAMHLAGTARGLAVLDYRQSRIVEFDTLGAVVRTTPIAGLPAMRMAVRGDTAYVGRSPTEGASTQAAYRAVELGTGRVTSGPQLAPEDQPYGLGLGLQVHDDALIVNTARPGVWMVARDNAWERRGTPLYPDDPPPTLSQTRQGARANPAMYTAGGIGVLGDSMIVQGFVSLPRPFDRANPPQAHELTHWLAVFSANGRHRGTIRLPLTVTATYVATDPEAGRLFLSAREPTPHVIEYRIVACPAEE